MTVPVCLPAATKLRDVPRTRFYSVVHLGQYEGVLRVLFIVHDMIVLVLSKLAVNFTG